MARPKNIEIEKEFRSYLVWDGETGRSNGDTDTHEVGVSLGIDKSEWGTYGFQERPLMADGQPTGSVAIFKRGKFVTLQSSKYSLLPHEEIDLAFDKMQDQLGIEKFEVPGRTHLQKDAFKFENKILEDGGRRMFSYWLFPGEYDMPGDSGQGRYGGGAAGTKGKMKYGLMAYNDIAGRMSFGGNAFSFRGYCDNIVTWAQKLLHNKKAQVNGDHHYAGQKLTGLSFKARHVGETMDVKSVMESFGRLVDEAMEMHEVYKGWVSERLTREYAQAIFEHMPKNVLPEYVEIEEEEDEESGEVWKNVKLMDSSKTVWGAWNDTTENIWHRPVGTQSKGTLFNRINSAIMVTV